MQNDSFYQCNCSGQEAIFRKKERKKKQVGVFCGEAEAAAAPSFLPRSSLKPPRQGRMTLSHPWDNTLITGSQS